MTPGEHDERAVLTFVLPACDRYIRWLEGCVQSVRPIRGLLKEPSIVMSGSVRHVRDWL